jgi:predicted Zn-dependent protease
MALLAACAAPKAELTESQEYYAGRAAAASLLRDVPLYLGDERLVEYVNLIGLVLAEKSERPEVFRGYHFVVVQSDNVNAFAAPGGFIFVTTQAIRECEDEDELAGLLAHEISHVVLQHPELEMRKQVQLQKAAQTAGLLGAIGIAVAGDRLGDRVDPNVMAEALDKTVDGFVKFASSGYGRDQELQADRLGAELLSAAGYDPRALSGYLARLGTENRRRGVAGWLSNTHPHPRVRRHAVEETIRSKTLSGVRDERRTARFREFTAKLKGE